MVIDHGQLHIMTIDCCEHTVAALEEAMTSRFGSVETRLTSLKVGGNIDELEYLDDIGLVVIGVSSYPVRRVFISQIRSVYPDVPMLILRRIESENADADLIRGEFVLSDESHGDDLDMVRTLRTAFPFKQCSHTPTEFNYNVVRNVMRAISDKYADPDLDLEAVAKALPMSSSQLSRILNQEVGVSFRQLLRHTRIEEAKRMLASHRYSVKEVAARVGFTDSHYFSRTFRALTGKSASEFRSQDAIFGG